LRIRSFEYSGFAVIQRQSGSDHSCFVIEIHSVLGQHHGVLKFLGKYREAGLLLLRASVGLIFILICGPVLLSGEHRWWQFGSAMRVFNFHSHLDWWGFLGALAGCVGGIFMMLGFAFRIGIILAFLVALVNAIAVSRHDHGFYSTIIPIEAVIVLVCLSFIGPGKYSVDKS
jgi:putative oxidoreductase